VRRLRAWAERMLSPSYGHCRRCHRPWRHGRIGANPHVTFYKQGSGLFVLCEGCWADLTPEKRLPFYDQLLGSWLRAGVPLREGMDAYDAVVRAVLLERAA
jgi:hypothetical protein